MRDPFCYQIVACLPLRQLVERDDRIAVVGLFEDLRLGVLLGIFAVRGHEAAAPCSEPCPARIRRDHIVNIKDNAVLGQRDDLVLFGDACGLASTVIG